MGTIYIVGLGPGNIESLTLGAIKRLNSGTENILRTKHHPTIQYLDDENINYSSYDHLYEEKDSFDEVYQAIVDDLREKSKSGDINYYVPGNPLVAERTVEILLASNLETKLISGLSFIEPILELVQRDPVNGLQIVDGAVFKQSMININVDTIITQVYNTRVLSDVKLILSEVYGDEYKLYLIDSAGMEDEKKYEIPVYELDRIENTGLLTSIYIPKKDEMCKKLFDMNDLLDIMVMLRSENGCPWDREQTHESLKSSLIEEAYELIYAIENDDRDNMVEELGDLLLQVIFHSQIGAEDGDFNIYDVSSKLGEKLIYRHPHVFLKKNVEKTDELVYNWDMLKYSNRGISRFTDKLRDIKGLPSLMTSYKIQTKAADIGFDWPHMNGVIDKIKEEYDEVLDSFEEFGKGSNEVEGEIGDLLFSIVNLSRFLDVDPEVGIKKTIDKFINRFDYMETEAFKLNKSLENMSLEEMDNLWNQAKDNN